MFCITGWIESEAIHPFITPTKNWILTWFGAHLCRHDTRLLIFWNKSTIVKLFFYKRDRNVNVFTSRGVTFLYQTKEVKMMLSSQFTVGAPVWSAKFSMYLRTALVFLTALSCSSLR